MNKSNFTYKAFMKKRINIPSNIIDVYEAMEWVDENILEEEWHPGDIIISEEKSLASRLSTGTITFQNTAVRCT